MEEKMFDEYENALKNITDASIEMPQRRILSDNDEDEYQNMT